MSAQRARSAVTPDHRSAHPNLPGVPWWGAALLAVTLTAIGFAYDAGSGDKELSVVFAALYVLGCVFAVLAVRQSGIFTAVIQPPLILFVAVPSSYFLFHGAKLTGIKDTLINFGYPLIERFPLMFFTSAAVLMIGMGRWYYGVSSRRGATGSAAKDVKEKTPSRVSSVTSKVSSMLTGGSADDTGDEADGETESRRRRHNSDRATRATKSTTAGKRANRAQRTTKRSAPSRSRHTRPPETEIIEPVAEHPRRPRTSRQSDLPPVSPAEPRRRPRTSSPREPRTAVPPAERRSSYERPERDRLERDRPERERPERRRRYDDYQPRQPRGSREAREPREPRVSNGSGTHHPISRVRYRGSGDEDDNRADHRSRPRSSRSGWEADSWEYDI